MYVKHTKENWDYLLHLDFNSLPIVGSVHYFNSKVSPIGSPYSLQLISHAFEIGDWVVVPNEQASYMLEPKVSVGDFVEIAGCEGDKYLVAMTGSNEVQLISIHNGNRWSAKTCKVAARKFKLSTLEKAIGEKLKLVDKPF